MTFSGSNDLSVQAESYDSHFDHDIKKFGPRLGNTFHIYVTSVKKTQKSRTIGKGETHEALESAFGKSFLL